MRISPATVGCIFSVHNDKIRRNFAAATALLTACTVVLTARSAVADDRFGESLEHDRAYNAHNRGDVASLDKILVAARLKGKVLDVQLKGVKYIIKLLDDNGRIKIVEIDASMVSGNGGGTSRGGGDGGGDGGRR